MAILHKTSRAQLTSALHSCNRRLWLWVAVVAIVSASLRFWQLARFQSLVFDEVYFVNYAQAYRQNLAPTDAHPPLGKYIIAAGIQLGSWLQNAAKPLAETDLANTARSPFSYRQANALIGSSIPLVVMGVARSLSALNQQNKHRQTSRQWSFAILCGLFVAIDGLFITESRYALLNVHVVCFGMLSHWLWLKAALVNQSQRQRILLNMASGIFLGAAIAVKWNGLGYLLSLITWEIYQVFQKDPDKEDSSHLKGKLKNLAFLTLTAAFTYSLIWWPHLHISQESILSVHANLFSFHQQLSTDGHPACSKWYSWPLLIRPITYWYSKPDSVAYTVSNLGNPALWLLSSSTVLLLAIRYLIQLQHYLSFKLSFRSNLRPKQLRPKRLKKSHPPNAAIAPYLFISYLCNWLPWMLVQRCTFNYLYMPAAVFSFMALSWLLSSWLRSPTKTNRRLAWLLLSLIAIAFIFWLPLALGLPLSPQGLKMRWLLKSWI